VESGRGEALAGSEGGEKENTRSGRKVPFLKTKRLPAPGHVLYYITLYMVVVYILLYMTAEKNKAKTL